jgi:hypothetical protein
LRQENYGRGEMLSPWSLQSDIKIYMSISEAIILVFNIKADISNRKAPASSGGRKSLSKALP